MHHLARLGLEIFCGYLSLDPVPVGQTQRFVCRRSSMLAPMHLTLEFLQRSSKIDFDTCHGLCSVTHNYPNNHLELDSCFEAV